MESAIVQKNIDLVQENKRLQAECERIRAERDRACRRNDMLRTALQGQQKDAKRAYRRIYEPRRQHNVRMDNMIDKAAVVVGTAILLALIALAFTGIFYGIDGLCMWLWGLN